MSVKPVCGIEMGGQTAAVAISTKLGEFLFKKKGIKTREPVTPIQAVEEITKTIKESGYDISAIGIASFGPVDLINGKIANTPKPGWTGFPIVEEFQKRFPGIPVVIDTDVNAPAYSEYLAYKETHPEARSVAYATVGTGIGVGVFADGHCLHGYMHPEVGHLYPMKHPEDNYEGACKFHGPCYEGMASALGIAGRKGLQPGELQNIPNDDKVWEHFAYYLGQLAAACMNTYSLDAFVYGGGIVTASDKGFLMPKIREYCEKFINGYVRVPEVITPKYGADAGLVGAVALALNSEIFIRKDQ